MVIHSMMTMILLFSLLLQYSSAYPPSLAGPIISPARLDRIFPTVTPVSVELGATNSGSGPYLTLVGKWFTEEYGAGSLRCKFKLEEGPVTVCAERITGGCTSTASDQTRYVVKDPPFFCDYEVDCQSF